MDTHYLKLTGKFETDKAVNIDQNYTLAVQGTVISTAKLSNNDWSFTFIHTFKPVYGVISSQDWEAIKMKDNRSNSTKLRSLAKYDWSQDSLWYDTPEEYYDALYLAIYKDMEELKSIIKK